MINLSRRLWLLSAAAGICAFCEELAVGKLLVATRKSRDPDLSESVVLLIHFGSDGAIGLTLNRPTRSPVARLFPDAKPAHGVVYDGGPVARGVRALFQTRAKAPDQAERIFGDVYLLADVQSIQAQASASSKRCRVYAGYTGWTPGQLKNEVAAGLWRVIPPEAAVVFDPDPGAVWSRLNAR